MNSSAKALARSLEEAIRQDDKSTVHINEVEELHIRNHSGFVPVEQYAKTEPHMIYTGEIGRIGGARFVRS